MSIENNHVDSSSGLTLEKMIAAKKFFEGTQLPAPKAHLFKCGTCKDEVGMAIVWAGEWVCELCFAREQLDDEELAKYKKMRCFK